MRTVAENRIFHETQKGLSLIRDKPLRILLGFQQIYSVLAAFLPALQLLAGIFDVRLYKGVTLKGK